MPFNPFSGSDGPNLEQGNPVGQTVKKAAAAAGGFAGAQAKAAGQSFVDQLYGNVSSAPDESDPQGTQNPQNMQAMQQAASASTGGSTSEFPKTPGEMSQIDETRKKLQELQGQHKKEYVDVTFGETAQKRRQQREEEERQMKAQQEQEEAERKAQEQSEQEESMGGLMPAGKKTGVQGRKRTQQPIALSRAKTKAEMNRGASG